MNKNSKMKFNVTQDNKYLEIIDATTEELSDLKYICKQRIDNWKFHPLVKKKLWDGYINFMDSSNHIPLGLWHEIKLFSKEYGFPFKISGLDRIIDFELQKSEIEDIFTPWFDSDIQDKYKLREYQLDSVFKILRYRRSVSEIATAAGKTLTIFMVLYFLLQHKNYKNILIIVPNISLVEQTMNDIEEYIETFKIDESLFKIQLCLGGESKKRKEGCNIVIGTYQTLSKIEPDFFLDIDIVCCDESHTAKVKSIQTIFKNLNHVNFRFGVSGTAKITDKVSNQKATAFTLESLLGPKIQTIKSKKLMDLGYVSPVRIEVKILDYLPESQRKQLKEIKKKQSINGNKLYSLERKLVINNSTRNEYILDLASKQRGVTLLLFADIKNEYGKTMFNLLNEKLKNTNSEVYYLDGSSNLDIRQMAIEEVNNNDSKNIFIFASFGIFSTGINIPSIENIFLLESYKSEIIIKQSIGRGMRLFKNKEKVVIYDFVDDFTIPGYENYLMYHGRERRKIYKEEKFDYTVEKRKFDISHQIF